MVTHFDGLLLKIESEILFKYFLTFVKQNSFRFYFTFERDHTKE